MRGAKEKRKKAQGEERAQEEKSARKRAQEEGEKKKKEAQKKGKRDKERKKESAKKRRRGRHSLRWFDAWAYNVGIGDRDELVKLGLQKRWIENIKCLGCELVCRCPRCGGEMVCGTVYDANGGVFVDIKGPPI